MGEIAELLALGGNRNVLRPAIVSFCLRRVQESTRTALTRKHGNGGETVEGSEENQTRECCSERICKTPFLSEMTVKRITNGQFKSMGATLDTNASRSQQRIINVVKIAAQRNAEEEKEHREL